MRVSTSGGGQGQPVLEGVRITADTATNSLLVYASTESYRIIEQTPKALAHQRMVVGQKDADFSCHMQIFRFACRQLEGYRKLPADGAVREGAPKFLRYPGAVSARRYKAILGEDKFQYMAVYEFASEAAFKRFQDSDHLKTLIKDYNANFSETSERERSAYVQIWP